LLGVLNTIIITGYAMRKLPQTLNKIINESSLKLHNISQASGISDAYLAKLVKGQINRPGKDKIASILLALNHTISDINQVLADYDYRPLHQEDIPDILRNNRTRKITGGNLPQYDHIYFDLFLVALERIGGVKILVKDRPSGVFMPDELYMMKEFPYEEDNAATRFRYHLIEELLKERTQLFIENCNAGYRLDTYICATCLDEYLEKHIGLIAQKDHPQRTLLVTRYFANALSLAIKLPQLHRMMIMERCPYFHLQIQDAEGAHPKVSYHGRKLHSFNNQYDRRNFEGITTDLPHIVAHFWQEIKMCQDAVIPEMMESYPEPIQSYIFKAFDHHGMGSALKKELAVLMADETIWFF
jgi:transcriptional regulator with XRE-family HTH domain